jgi:histidine ammonia-lyase
MTAVLTGANLDIEGVVRVAREREPVGLHPDSRAAISRCRTFLERKIEEGAVIYGVNTGIGEFSEVALDPEQLKQFQRILIYNHAAGMGEPMPEEWVRAAMVGRINVHAHGNSGCRLLVTEMLVEMLNRGVTPIVCRNGSVGACGDLAPMSQLALAAIGEGESVVDGDRLPATEALARVGLEPLVLEARDGLAMINGSNFITALGSLFVHDAEKWLRVAEITAAMSLEALLANLKPYDERLHELRGFDGAVKSARNIQRCLEGSDLQTGKFKTRVQDAYSMRSTPQVIGAARDQLRWTREQLEIELNGVGDNPIFLPDDDTFLTGANFQGSPVSLPLDGAGAAICMISVLSERRLNRLLNPALSAGLPAFLTEGAGMYSGLMLSQYTADMLIVNQRLLSAPASVQSIPAAADQEDFVSMGWNTAMKTQQILDDAYGVLAIEMIAAAQALDFREFTPGRGTTAAHRAVRAVVKRLHEDRPLFNDHNAMREAVASGVILKAVEAEIGELA